MSGALWQNGHGGNKLLGTAQVSRRHTAAGSQTDTEERLRCAQTVPVVAGRGRGRYCWFGRLELQQMSANPSTTPYDTYNASCTMRQRQKKRGLGSMQTYSVHHPLSYHRFAPAGRQHQDSQSPRQQWQEVPPGTAREDSGETCNKHRPKPAPQSTCRLRLSCRHHSENPPTAYDWAGPRSHARDDEPAAHTPAATRRHDTTWGRHRHCQKHLP